MLQHLHTKLSLLVIVSVSASLPSPKDVTMIPFDLNYTLQWDWTSTELRNSTTFTAEYAFQEDQHENRLYIKVCEGSWQHRCDFTHRLDFRGSYIIRVRAESGGEHSDWKYVSFTPDEDGVLGPPSQVSIEADVTMLILNISKSLKSTEVKLRYQVQYWERERPAQKQLRIYDNPYVSLVSLKPWTEYCVQVNVFDQNFGMNGTYTSPQCVSTKGFFLYWQIVFAVLCILLVGALAYICCMFRRQSAKHKTPDSILGLPLDLPSPLEVHEATCAVALVTAPSVWLQSSQHPLEEQDGTSGIQAVSTLHGSNSSEHDSGFGSAQESR